MKEKKEKAKAERQSKQKEKKEKKLKEAKIKVVKAQKIKKSKEKNPGKDIDEDALSLVNQEELDAISVEISEVSEETEDKQSEN